MGRSLLLCGLIVCALVGAGTPGVSRGSELQAQEDDGLGGVSVSRPSAIRRRRSPKKRPPQKAATICGNPKAACETTFNFRPHDLPFRLPKNSVIFDTEPFYAVILKSVRVANNCDTAFVPETERLQAQALFPDHKVFTSRCPESLEVFYTNVSPNQNFMAVYAGRTRAEAGRVLAAVKATGRFPGANLRRLRAGINGT